MNNNAWHAIGKVFFALAILAIGMVHLVTRNFPAGLLPVPGSSPDRHLLVYVSGVALVIAGFLILSHYYLSIGAKLAMVIWLIFLLGLHLPIVIHNYKNANDWTASFGGNDTG
jgi:uncharacterized membrane protein